MEMRAIDGSWVIFPVITVEERRSSKQQEVRREDLASNSGRTETLG